MTHRNGTAPADCPQDDTRHEGIQAALDALHSRRSALSQMIDDAQKRGAIDRALELDIRHAEVCGLTSALRGLLRSAS